MWRRGTVPTSVNGSPVCVRLAFIFAAETVRCHRITMRCASVYIRHSTLPFEEWRVYAASSAVGLIVDVSL